LTNAGIRFIAAVGSGKLGELEDRANRALKEPGNWIGYWNNNTSELYILYWDRDINIGKRQAITSAYKFKQGYRQLARLIPAYDLYKLVYGGCDHYNRNLHDKCWPFKHGGKNSIGDYGTTYDFIFSCTVHNIINAEREISKTTGEKLNYQTYLVDLACSLYEYEMKLSH
jgi:hypothetical protein